MDPEGETKISKSMLLDLLTERGTLLMQVQQSTPDSPQGIMNSSQPSSDKIKKVTSSISSTLRRRRNTVAVKDWNHFKELTSPNFIEKVNIESLALWPVRRLPQRALTCIRGPGESSMETQIFETFAGAKAISNYPLVPGRPFREGDPICDRYLVKLYEDQILIALADGCNWGKMPKKAAKRATKRLMETIDEFHDDITNVRNAGAALLLGFSRAHEYIIGSDEELSPGSGKTTMVAGLLLQSLSEEASSNKTGSWFFVFVTLGDCKFFHYSPSSRTVRDLTFLNRDNLLDASDPGGRLGGECDLRNLSVECRPVKEGEFIIAVSDGVHDNFDPQNRGISPKELGLKVDKWEDVKDVKKGMIAKSKWMEQEIYHTLEKLPTVCPEDIVNCLTEESYKLTQSSRDFMESNPSQKLPDDTKLYPGKLDHCSCACVMVGGVLKALHDDFKGNVFAESEEMFIHQAMREREFSQVSKLKSISSASLVNNKSSSISSIWRSTSTPLGDRPKRTFLNKQ